MSMPRAVRHINEIRALDAVFTLGPMSRATLARELGLTRSTAGAIVAGLVDEGLMVEGESDPGPATVPASASVPARTGRPGTLVRLRPDHALFVGTDIGVGRISTVVIDLEARKIAEEHEAFALDEAPGRVVERAFAQAAAILRALGARQSVRGIAVTVPGIVDKEGVVVRVPILGWSNVPVLPRLRETFPEVAHLAVENDANAFAMAELYRGGGGEAVRDAAYVFMDAGIGGAVVADGVLLRGHHGYAGEFGHLPLGGAGFSCAGVIPGSLEAYVGRGALLERHRFHGGSADTLEAMLARLAAGEPAALRTARDWCAELGRALAGLTALLDPQRIVLGGPVAAVSAYGPQVIAEALAAHVMPGQPVPQVRLSALGLDGAAIGGASILHRAMLSVDRALVYHAPR